MTRITRRDFTTLAAAMFGFVAGDTVRSAQHARGFQIALDERSLKRMLAAGTIEHLELARIARTTFGIDAVQYASSFFKSMPQDDKYLAMMNERAAEQEVRQLLIVVDSESPLGVVPASSAILQPYRAWIDAAKVLGCHSIAVPITKAGSFDERMTRCTETLTALCDYAEVKQIHVVVGDDIESLADLRFVDSLLSNVKHKQCGAMLTFHALLHDEVNAAAVNLIPRAKAICATAREFDAQGEETTCNFRNAVTRVSQSGYHGYLAIHYQGGILPDLAGVKAVYELLQSIQQD
jgi:hypothetical protein